MSAAYYRKKRQQQQMLQMQAMNNPSFFFYKGDTPNLQRRLMEVASNLGQPINDAYIVVVGSQVQQHSLLVVILTVILGIFLIFPLICMFFDCWKKLAYPAYEIPLQVYQKLQYLINNPMIKSLHLEVCDSCFNGQKAKLLYEMLSKSEIKTIFFSNSATNMDFKQNEYSNFVENMKPIKMLPIQSNLRWWLEVVQ